MRLAIPLALLVLSGPVYAQLSNGSTVNDFAIYCQHPAQKTNPELRSSTCIGFIESVKNEVATRNKTTRCYDALTEKAGPMVVADVLYADALDQKRRSVNAAKAIREVISIAAPECKQ